MSEPTTIIAFDQHVQSVMAAVLDPREAEPALHSMTSDLPTIGRFVKRLLGRGPVRCCYEAGPCGFALQRFLVAHDVPCEVIAPTLIPRRPGDRIKTDRRDARQLAVLYRAGALTAIHIPSELEEAIRICSGVEQRIMRLGSATQRVAPEPPVAAARARADLRRLSARGGGDGDHSSGSRRGRGAITKTGNAHLRRILLEAAWHYRHHPSCRSQAA